MTRSAKLGAVFMLFILGPPATAGTVTFEDLGLTANSFENGNPALPGSSGFTGGAFTSGGATFNNSYDGTFGVWFGWAASTTTDSITPGFGNQYSAITGTGAAGSATYAVAYTSGDNTNLNAPAQSYINLPAGMNPASIALTNTTYAYTAMLNGDSFGDTAFGAGDFFKLDVLGFTGANGSGTLVGDVPFFLANGTSIVNTWQALDLSSLKGSQSLQFQLTSSQNDPLYGMITPAYFAADNLALLSQVPEPSALILALAASICCAATCWRAKRNTRAS
jgi:hypothetical protein